MFVQGRGERGESCRGLHEGPLTEKGGEDSEMQANTFLQCITFQKSHYQHCVAVFKAFGPPFIGGSAFDFLRMRGT